MIENYSHIITELTKGLHFFMKNYHPGVGYSNLSISVSPRGNRKDHTWLKSSLQGDDTVYQICFSKEIVGPTLTKEKLIEGLLHNIVHFINLSQDIRDTSPDGYHTVKFKEVAEKTGLIVEKHKYLGYCLTKLSQNTVLLLDNLPLNLPSNSVTVLSQGVQSQSNSSVPIEPNLKLIVEEFSQLTGLSIQEVVDKGVTQFMKCYKP